MKIQSKDLRCRNYQKDMPKIAYCDGVVNLDAERLQDSVQLFPHFLVDYDGAPVILETVSPWRLRHSPGHRDAVAENWKISTKITVERILLTYLRTLLT